MPDKNRDTYLVKKILQYCDDITQAHNLFKDSYDEFRNNSVYRNSVALCLLQIGELSIKLTDDFKEKHSNIPWRAIRGMRNIVAHEYGHIDEEILWETSHKSVDLLREFCQKII